jgi:Mn-dependent DtxR family transcriptional regulator
VAYCKKCGAPVLSERMAYHHHPPTEEEPMKELTKRQEEYLAFVKCFSGDAGKGVTVNDVAIEFDTTGSNAAAMMKALLAKGAVTEDRSRRALVYRAV